MDLLRISYQILIITALVAAMNIDTMRLEFRQKAAWEKFKLTTRNDTNILLTNTYTPENFFSRILVYRASGTGVVYTFVVAAIIMT